MLTVTTGKRSGRGWPLTSTESSLPGQNHLPSPKIERAAPAIVVHSLHDGAARVMLERSPSEKYQAFVEPWPFGSEMMGTILRPRDDASKLKSPLHRQSAQVLKWP